MLSLLTDVRYTLRAIRQSPAFYGLLIAILASGIAATVSVFALVDGVVLRPLPYRDPAALVVVQATAIQPPFESNGSFTYAQFEQIRARSHAFEAIAAAYRQGFGRQILKDNGNREEVQVGFVSPNFLTLFGRSLTLGRWFDQQENTRAERVLVIREDLAARRFGSAAAALGRDLEMAGAKWRIVGVMPADFRVPSLNTQLWAPIQSHPEWNDRREANARQISRRWDVLGRLSPGTTLRAAQAELDAIYGSLERPSADDPADRALLVPLREHFSGVARRPLAILSAAVALLLLITLANAGNLFLSRAASRQREFAIRSALGAGAGRLASQAFAEALTLCLIAGALSGVLSPSLVRLLKLFVPAGTPLLDTVAVNARVLLFTVAVSLLAAAFVAVLSMRRTARNTADPLKAAGRSATASRETRRLKNALVVIEFALAMVLLTGTSLLVRSFLAVNAVDLGFQPRHVLTMRVEPPDGLQAAQLRQFYRNTEEKLHQVPGVEAAGAAKAIFQLNITRTHALREIEGHPKEPVEHWGTLEWDQISGEYFQAMGVPLERGRFFDERDGPDAPPVVIVNQTLARRYWPGEDAIGKRVKGMDPRGKNDDWLTVVGVVKDMRSGGAESQPFSQIYEPQAQSGELLANLVVRTHGDPGQFAAAARAAIREVSPTARISAMTTMDRELAGQESARRFQTWLTGMFSAVALALAALGVFAVMHFSVAAKTHEIGIRMAVGARPPDILRLMLRDGTRLAIAGIALGAVASTWTAEALRALLFGVAPDDPASFGLAAALLTVVALAACYLPAARAARLDPLSALRED